MPDHWYCVVEFSSTDASEGQCSTGSCTFIKSRQAGGHGDFRGYFNTSLSNVGLAAEKRFIGGALGAAVVARRSLDTESRLNSDVGQLPDDFFDVVGTIDLDIDERRRLEISGIWEEDFIRGDIDDGPIDNQMEWGNRAGRVTLQLPLFGGVFRQTLGFSRFNNTVAQTVRKSRLALFDPRPTQPSTQNDIKYGLVSGEFVAANANDRGGWRGGYQLSQYRVSYLGASANPFPVQTFNYRLLIKQDVTVAALWAERRWELERLSLQAGLRVEAGDGHGEDWGAALAPRLSARYAVDDRLSISGAAGRSYQYLHELAPAGLRLGPRLATSHIRLAAGEDGTVPLRTDMLSAGAEYWLSREWLATANTYVRYSTGAVMPDPSPGSIDEQRFRVNGTNLARGLELSARRLAG